MTYTCPLCSLDFEEAQCHTSCPMSSGCAMVRCPRCLYEFVEDGEVTKLLRRLAPLARRVVARLLGRAVPNHETTKPRNHETA